MSARQAQSDARRNPSAANTQRAETLTTEANRIAQQRDSIGEQNRNARFYISAMVGLVKMYKGEISQDADLVEVEAEVEAAARNIKNVRPLEKLNAAARAKMIKAGKKFMSHTNEMVRDSMAAYSF